MGLFKVGDGVTWTSQAGGYSKVKTGAVVEVIPPGKRPECVPGCGFSRKHESYVIAVKRPRSVALYWPNVSALEKAK